MVGDEKLDSHKLRGPGRAPCLQPERAFGIGEKFFIRIGRNPLKSLVSKK